MPRSSRNWCDAADSLMPTSDAIENPHPCRITEGAECLGKRFDRTCTHQQGLSRRRKMGSRAVGGGAGGAFFDWGHMNI